MENALKVYENIVPDIMLGILIKCLPCIIILLLIAVIIIKVQKNSKMGALKTASREKACGIIFGMILTLTGPKVIYSPIDDEGSVLVWGTSGSGKTDGILRPTINSLQDAATTFCIDISGDIVSTIKIKKKIVFGPNAENSAAYNVFFPVDIININSHLSDEEKQGKIIEQLDKIASQIIPLMKDGEEQGAVVFFNNGGNAIIKASLIAGYYKGLDFADITVLIFKNNYEQHSQWIKSCGIEIASDLIEQYDSIKEEQRAGCMNTAKTAISCIASSYKIQKFLHRPRKINGKTEPYYTPKMLETHSVFYVVNDGTDFDLYAPLTRLVVSQTMEYLQTRDTKKNKHTILLTLDEYSSLSIAKETTAAAKKYRKKSVRLLVLTQSTADMDLMTREGNTASRAIIDNFPYRMILGAQDPKSQLYFAECVGKHDVTDGGFQNTPSRTSREFWIQPEDFGRLDKHLVLIHPKGHMVLGKNYYHKSMKKIISDAISDFSIFKWGIH